MKTGLVLLVSNIPTPYRIPLFNELARQLAGLGFSLKVVFGSLGYGRRKWRVDLAECRFEYEVLASRKVSYADPEKVSFTYSGLGKLIRRERPAVLVTNGFSMATVKAWACSWTGGTPYVIWSGAVRHPFVRESALRRLQRRILIRRAAGFVAYGSKAREYLIFLGALPGRISIGINTVDVDFFREQTQALRQGPGSTEEAAKSLLYIGDLSKRKRLDLVLRAVRDLGRRRSDFFLFVVGDGPEAGRLGDMALDLGIGRQVRFEGFKQRDELPSYMAHASCLLFPTDYDIWGLVLNEAMSAGLPCLASIQAGATCDLIKDGVTGFSLDFKQTDKVVDRIEWVLDNPGPARQVGENAARFITEQASLERSAGGFIEAVRRALREPKECTLS